MYAHLIYAGVNKPLRYAASFFCIIFCFAAAFVFGRRVQKKEVYILIAVFETVLLVFNGAQSVYMAVKKSTSAAVSSGIRREFNVNKDSPSPNIYWLFMDGMLGFEGVERLFGDEQKDFAAALKDRGFVINKDAEFEVFHATKRATAALFSPSWYDGEFLPLLKSINLDDYAEKEKKLKDLDPVEARKNNELILALRAKGYTINAVGQSDVFMHNNFYETADVLFYENGLLRNINEKKLFDYNTNALNLNTLIESVLACYKPFHSPVGKMIQAFYSKKLNPEPVEELNEYAVKCRPDWYFNSLFKTFSMANPKLTIIHDTKAHIPFMLNENGDVVVDKGGTSGFDPQNYPPQHRYASKILMEYISLILEYDADAVIVAQADHGLHSELPREIFLENGGSAEDVRIMQNQTMSAVRIPEKWGGLEEPLNPLNISRVFVNRYVGENYELLGENP
jgi:hypothetical protein